MQARRTLEVTIPAGVTDGTQLRLKGQGGRAPRPDQNGDLFLTIRIEPNPVFAIAGRDLRVNLPVWDYEAALGAEITAPTIDGRVSLKIPAGSQTGRVMRLRGRGLPARGKEPAGDLLYELKVLAPTDLNAKERALMQQLADSLKDRGVADPRAELMASKEELSAMARRTSTRSASRGKIVLMSRSVFCSIGGISERELASWEREDLIAPARVERVRGRVEELYDREALRRVRVIRTLGRRTRGEYSGDWGDPASAGSDGTVILRDLARRAN